MEQTENESRDQIERIDTLFKFGWVTKDETGNYILKVKETEGIVLPCNVLAWINYNFKIEKIWVDESGQLILILGDKVHYDNSNKMERVK